MKMKKIGAVVLAAVMMCVTLGGCSDSTKIAIPFSSSEKGIIAYEDALDQLEEAGFTNITSEVETTTTGSRNGILKSITVDGEDTFNEGDKVEPDVAVEIVYYELAEYEVTLDIVQNGSDGIPTFTVNTNLPDETRLTLTLTDGNGYEKEQTVEIEDGTATSKEFTTSDINPLPAGEYTLTVVMRMDDQGFFSGSEARNTLGSNGECMTGEYVQVDSDGTQYIYAEYEYTSTYEEEATEQIDLDTLIAVFEVYFTEGFGDNYEIIVDGSMVEAYVWEDGLAYLAAFAQAGDADSLSSWNTLVDSAKSASESCQDMLSNAGHSEMFFVLSILNDLNTDNVLLVVMDGVVFFDYGNNVNLLG